MPTPPKSFAVLTSEKKSHRTKAELAAKKQAELGALSGVAMKESKEVKNRPIAHKTYKQLKKLMKEVGKDDALYENSVHRYCLLTEEEYNFREMLDECQCDLDKLRDISEELDPRDYVERRTAIQKNIINLDKQIQTKRKMLNDMEKENGWTVSSAARIIPKKAEKQSSALKMALGG